MHAYFDRFALSAGGAASAGSLVDQCFGGRLAPHHTADVFELDALYRMAYETRSEAYVPNLLALAYKGLETGDVHLRALGLIHTVDCLRWVSPRDGHVLTRALEDEFMVVTEAPASPEWIARAHYWQARPALDEADWGDAERHLAGFDFWQTSRNARDRLNGHGFMGAFARKRGDLEEAEVHYREAIPIANAVGDHLFAGEARGHLRDCDDELARANRRKTKPRRRPAAP